MLTRLTCCVAGGSALTIHCAERLLAKGHSITAVVARSPSVGDWATINSIPAFSDFEELLAFRSAETEFDYLFSIINDLVLNERMLALARRLAINYHNGPLPRYAGVFATSWAILNSEIQHGMTWHVMTPRIDGGDILKGASFTIGVDDTAAILNVRCQESAAATFEELVDDLASGTVQRNRQDLTRRTYYPLTRKPPGAGLISWAHPAADIRRLVRALTRGPIVNSFELPKFPFRDSFLIPTVVETLPTSSEAEPGTVLEDPDQVFRVATATADLRIAEVMTPNGDVLRARLRDARLGLNPGDRLPVVTSSLAAQLETAAARVAGDEGFCVQAFCEARACRPSITPSAPTGPAHAHQLWLPNMRGGSIERVSHILAALPISSPDDRVSVMFSTPAMREQIRGLEAFMTAALPITIDRPAESRYRRLSAIAKTAQLAEQRGVHVRDLLLRRKAGVGASQPLPIAIEVVPSATTQPSLPDRLLTVQIPQSGDWVRLCSGFDPIHGGYSPAALAVLGDELYARLQAVISQN